MQNNTKNSLFDLVAAPIFVSQRSFHSKTLYNHPVRKSVFPPAYLHHGFTLPPFLSPTLNVILSFSPSITEGLPLTAD